VPACLNLSLYARLQTCLCLPVRVFACLCLPGLCGGGSSMVPVHELKLMVPFCLLVALCHWCMAGGTPPRTGRPRLSQTGPSFGVGRWAPGDHPLHGPDSALRSNCPPIPARVQPKGCDGDRDGDGPAKEGGGGADGVDQSMDGNGSSAISPNVSLPALLCSVSDTLTLTLALTHKHGACPCCTPGSVPLAECWLLGFCGWVLCSVCCNGSTATRIRAARKAPWAP